MVQNRAAGNGNFDIDAITQLVNADPNAPAMDSSNTVKPDITEEDELARLGGATTLANASMFIDGVIIPENRSEHILREASFANRLDTTGMTIGSGSGGGQIKVITSKDQDGNGVDDEKENGVEDYADAAEDLAQQRQEAIERQQRAEAWANSDHTYAGQKMSATEWLRVIAWFKDPANRAAWEDAMIAETGESRDEVRKTRAKMDRLDELIEKQSRGEKLTPEEQAEMNRLNNDRDVQNGMRIRREKMALEQNRPQVSNHSDALSTNASANDTNVDSYMKAGADMLAADATVVNNSASHDPRSFRSARPPGAPTAEEEERQRQAREAEVRSVARAAGITDDDRVKRFLDGRGYDNVLHPLMAAHDGQKRAALIEQRATSLGIPDSDTFRNYVDTVRKGGAVPDIAFVDKDGRYVDLEGNGKSTDETSESSRLNNNPDMRAGVQTRISVSSGIEGADNSNRLSLGGEFKAAKAATEPLDTALSQRTNLSLASNLPQVGANGGLEI